MQTMLYMMISCTWLRDAAHGHLLTLKGEARPIDHTLPCVEHKVFQKCTVTSGVGIPVLLCIHRDHSVDIPWLEIIHHNHIYNSRNNGPLSMCTHCVISFYVAMQLVTITELINLLTFP